MAIVQNNPKAETKPVNDTRNMPTTPYPEQAPAAQPKKAVIYFCTKGQYTFSIPVYETDGFGEIVMKDGKPKQLIETDADGNHSHKVFQDVKFDRFPVIDPKTKKTDATINIGRFIIEPENPRYDELLSVIERGRKNPYNSILTEAEYKNWRNPLAFQHEQETETIKGEKDALAAENKRLKDALRAKGVSVD